MGLAKLIALLMVLLLIGSSFVGLINYFIKFLIYVNIFFYVFKKFDTVTGLSLPNNLTSKSPFEVLK